jgi:hypothetical protein
LPGEPRERLKEAEKRDLLAVRGHKIGSLFEATNKDGLTHWTRKGASGLAFETLSWKSNELASRTQPRLGVPHSTPAFGVEWATMSPPQPFLRRAVSSYALRHGLLVNDHLRCAELVSQHAKAEGKEGLLHRHEDLAAFGEQSMNSLRLFCTIDSE